MGELSNLPNIGKIVEAQLNDVGIFTYEGLKKTGTEATWLKIQQIAESACWDGYSICPKYRSKCQKT